MNPSIDDIKKSSRGRPRADTSPVMVRMSAEELARVDDYRRHLPDMPTRPEAIRRLVSKSLAAELPERLE